MRRKEIEFDGEELVRSVESFARSISCEKKRKKSLLKSARVFRVSAETPALSKTPFTH